jgi:hypothetical protein
VEKLFKLFSALIIISELFISNTAIASALFEQKANETAKWSRIYAKFGRATGEFGDISESFNANFIGYKQMRGMFGYGAETGFLFANGDKISSLSATMSFRPDWNLDAEPSFDLSYGTADLSSSTTEKNGHGTISSIGVSLDVIKGKFYSTTLGVANYTLKSDAQSVKATSFQSVTMSLNFDLY